MLDFDISENQYGYVDQYDHHGLNEDGDIEPFAVRATKTLYRLPNTKNSEEWGCDHCGGSYVKPTIKQVDYLVNLTTGEREDFDRFYVCNQCTGDLNLFDTTLNIHIPISEDLYIKEPGNQDLTTSN